MKYAFPAIFTFSKEDNCYYVNFPDMENVFTDGETLLEALENAEDVLPLMLCQMEDDKEPIPKASDMKSIVLKENEFISLIPADTLKYRNIDFSESPYNELLGFPEECLNTIEEMTKVFNPDNGDDDFILSTTEHEIMDIISGIAAQKGYNYMRKQEELEQ